MDIDLAFLAPFALALLATGALAGVLAGLLGVGGGIVIVPVLYLVLPALGVEPAITMHIAVATSLATIVPTGLVSARSHLRRGGVDLAVLKRVAPWVVVGVGLGLAVGARSGGAVLTAVFASVALLVAVYMATTREGWRVAQQPPGWLGMVPIGLGLGGFSVVMGIGGGTLGVPTLTACNLPIRKAVGTSAAIGPIIALPGVLGFVAAGWGHPDLPPFSLGYANALGFLLIAPTTILCAPLGARLAHSIPPAWLRRAFALFLLLTSARMFWGLLG